jgi:hypothetical protein
MEAVERAAHLSVGRACAFGALAILCFMVGFSYEPHLSARVGGSFALLMSGVLLAKAWLAAKTPYKQTELWLLLDEADRPPKHLAQELIATVLRGVYLIYARYAALMAALLLAASVLFGWMMA